MAMHSKPFDAYKLFYFAGDALPCIDCYSGSTHVGSLFFHPDGESLKQNGLNPEGIVRLRYHLSQWDDVTRILRYEKPLFLRIQTPSCIGFIATEELEPVGEEESSGAPD